MAELSEKAAGYFCTGRTDPFMIDSGNNVMSLEGLEGNWDVVGVVSI